MIPALTELLLTVVVGMVPPGRSVHSVEVCSEGSADCQASSFYGSPVRQETPDHAAERYHGIAQAIVDVATVATCTSSYGDSIPGCEPEGSWTLLELVSMLTAVSIAESGWREDVQVGRGWSKKPSDDGGRGRGPGWEVCLMQIHPINFSRWFPTVQPSEVPANLLGADSDSTHACFSAGASALIRARRYCSWKRSGTHVGGQDWRTWTVSMYGTGTSCSTPNAGKTAYRVGLYDRVYSQLRRLNWPAT